MQQSSNGQSISRDEHGALAADIACRRCAYNLRGLREDGRCPECGSPIGLSTQGDLLRFADPEWLDKVALGLKIILWMILVNLVIVVLSSVISVMGSMVAGNLLSLAASIASFFGVWLMTEPDPSGIGEDPNLTARKIVRVTLLIGLGGELLGMIADSFFFSASMASMLRILGLAAMLISLPGEFAKFVYYGRLAARIPDDHVVRRARFLKWAFTLTFGLMIVGGASLSLLAGGPATTFGAASFVLYVMVPAGIAITVFSVMTLLLLLRLRRAIADEAQLARNTWAAADYGPVASDGSTHSRG